MTATRVVVAQRFAPRTQPDQCPPYEPATLDDPDGLGKDRGAGSERRDRRAASGRAAGSDLDTATLVARARDGDLTSFEALVRRYQQPIFALALRMTDRPADAEDVTQEVFVTAWRRLPEIQVDSAFGSWLYRTATNRCLALLRSAKPVAPFSDAQLVTTDPRTAPDRVAESAQAMAALVVALRSLTPDQRACWLLREVHGRSYDEIAGIVGTTAIAVRGRIARARSNLAEAMQPWQ